MRNHTARRNLCIVFLATFAGAILHAQTAAPPPPPKPLAGSTATHPGWVASQSRDTATPEALVAALYAVISGPAGPRDWDRFRSLFLPDGRLGIVRPATPAHTGPDGKDVPARAGDMYFLTPEQYIERDDPFFKTQGFFERSIANRVEQFGNLTSVWSTYESRHAASDPVPFARGINSIQIVYAQDRYWVASILWDDERPGLTLPDKYLRP